MNDAIIKVLTGVIGAGIIAICSILWGMSNTLTEIKTTVKFIEKDFADHEDRITGNTKRITKLESQIKR